MEKRTLGKSTLEISPLGMGCWAIGGPWWYVGEDGKEPPSPSGWGQVDDDESVKALHAAFDLGITFYDTADVYGCGHSELVLGRAFAGRRDKVVIATKFGKQFDEQKKHYFGHKTSSELIRSACEDSLRRLGTDYIDLYQFHWGDYDDDPAIVQDTLEGLVQEGKIRWYGWSTDDRQNAKAWLGGEHYTAVQHALHVAYTKSHNAKEMRALCESNHLASINRGPLAMGILTGKFDAQTTFPEDDIRHDWDLSSGRLNEIMEQMDDLRTVLISGGRSLVQGALAWLWGFSETTIPSPGFKNVQQVTENAQAMAFGPLTADQMRQIDEILDRV
ncbi:MAG: aldo/keto reductase [Anaerolineales bacterium]